MSVTAVSTAIAPSTIVSILRCLSTASASIPIPGITPAIAIVSAIMEIVESIRTAKNDCKALAEKAAQFVITLHQEASTLDSNSPAYIRIQSNIGPFKSILEEIQSFIMNLSRRNKLTLVWKRDSVLQRVAELANSLDTCYRTFQITALVHLQTALSQFSDEQALSAKRIHQRLTGVRRATIMAQEQGFLQLTAEMRAMEQNIATTLRSDISATTRLLEQVAVDVKNGAGQNSMLTNLSEIEPVEEHIPMTEQHGGVTIARYRNRDVLVKRFQGAKGFIQELPFWRDIWHPHLPRLVAFSSDSERRPFVVLDGKIAPHTVNSYLLKSLKGGPVAGLMAGFQIVYSMTTALEYLRASNLLSKAELAKCLQPSDVLLTNNNGVMLGSSLLSCATIRPNLHEYHRDETLEELLAERLFVFMLQTFRPEGRFGSLEVNAPRSVLRLLILFAAFNPMKGRNLKQIRKMMDVARKTLLPDNSSDLQPSIMDVQRCFLQVEGLRALRASILQPHWTMRTGDIGYVLDNNFVAIGNGLDVEASGLYALPEETLTIQCDPPRPYTVTLLQDGWKRYEFSSPSYVSMLHSYRYAIDDKTAVRYMLQHAHSWVEKSSVNFLRPADLIMVVNRETRPRHSGVFNFTPSPDDQSDPPEKVYFFASYNSTPDEIQTAYWSVNPELEQFPTGPEHNITDSRVRASCISGRSQNMFEFVQLEEQDLHLR